MILYLNTPNTPDITQQDLLNTSSFSQFGTPVFSDIEFDLDGDKVKIIHSVIEVTRQNTIVAMPLQGRNGTVKEYISAQDWVVTVRGSIQSTDPQKYPLEDIRTIVKMMGKGERIEVVSEYLALFDIHSIVLESDNYPQNEAQQNIQQFELRFLSDEDLELIMKDNN